MTENEVHAPLVVDRLTFVAFPSMAISSGATVDILLTFYEPFTVHRFTCNPTYVELLGLRLTRSETSTMAGASLRRGLDWTLPRPRTMAAGSCALLSVINPTGGMVVVSGAVLWGKRIVAADVLGER